MILDSWRNLLSIDFKSHKISALINKNIIIIFFFCLYFYATTRSLVAQSFSKAFISRSKEFHVSNFECIIFYIFILCSNFKSIDISFFSPLHCKPFLKFLFTSIEIKWKLEKTMQGEHSRKWEGFFSVCLSIQPFKKD